MYDIKDMKNDLTLERLEKTLYSILTKEEKKKYDKLKKADFEKIKDYASKQVEFLKEKQNMHRELLEKMKGE
jgi:hypothetical protein